MKGILTENIIIGILSEDDIIFTTPTNVLLESVEDFTRISFDDETGGIAKHEIWYSKAGADYELLVILDAGVTDYDYTTYQMEDYSFKIRAGQDELYSAFTDEAAILTPLVFYTDQTESFRTVNFRQIKLDDVSSIDVHWGDGEITEDYTPVGNVYDEVNHDYTVPGEYWIQIKGAITYFSTFQFYDQPVEGTDISKWKWRFRFIHMWNNGYVGDVRTIEWPTDLDYLLGVHLSNNNDLEGDFDDLMNVERPNFFDCHLPIGGNAEEWVLSPQISQLVVSSGLYGDISDWRFPKGDVGLWKLYLQGEITGDITYLLDGVYQYMTQVSLINLDLDGDLSGWFVGADYDLDATEVVIYGNNFTALPRGNFYKFDRYWCESNNCDSSEVDSILADIETNVTANAPLYDCTYRLDGTGMGIPSAAGLTSKTNIEAVYVTAGKTCTIDVN